jgi:drug/metabolite transporter (DMT)-like permease
MSSQSTSRTAVLSALALLAFAGNSLLCRMALRETSIDPATFTVIRLCAGALVLWLLLLLRGQHVRGVGSWRSAFALFGYAALFSFAYVALATGTGALLLFGAVQASMIGVGIARGEQFSALQWGGFALALLGLGALLLPGATAPPLWPALLMIGAGVAWGAYSLLGRNSRDPIGATAGNFIRTLPMVLLLGLVALPWLRWDAAGAGYALFSGALTSGLGYVIWYAALRGLDATRAATLQLATPVLAALLGLLLLSEPIGLRFVLAAAAVLGGIAIVIHRPTELRHRH